MSDTQTSSESSPLDINGGAEAFAALLADPVEEKASEPVEPEEVKEPEEAESEVEPEAEATSDEEGSVTIEVDGKPVTLTKEQLAEAYKSGLRQADYTRKTMETAEQRKEAEAERTKALQERQQYAQKLNEQAMLLGAVLQEQSQVNWQQLIDSDPVEYLKQRNLYEQRQAAYQRVQQEQYQVQQLSQAEQAKAHEAYLREQQETLLAKLPEWKDAKKSAAEKQAIRDVLKDMGYTDAEMNITDHRAILLAREALKYRQLTKAAQAASKKVETLPQKVVRPGSGAAPSLDKRGAAFQRLSKTGRVEDAAAVFASIL